MNNRQRQQLKIRLDDIDFDFMHGNKNRAFNRLVDVIKQLVDEIKDSGESSK